MNERDKTVLEVLEKGYFTIVKEKWAKTRGKGAKMVLRFMIGMVGFTVGYAFLRAWQAVSETSLDIIAWLNKRNEKKSG